ncbi:MAG TPA: hypothetical protein VGE07_29425 [Herpetosiphonaceae bacterium]
MDPDPSGKGFFGSMADYIRKQNDALQQSLEPDPDADEITRIDQEWIKQCSRLLHIDRGGLLKGPSLLAPLGPLIAMVVGAALLMSAIGRRFNILSVGTYCFAIFGLVLAVAGFFGLIQMGKYFGAASAYRRRRAAALSALGRADDRPLPVIERPIWAQAGVMDVETALQRLEGAYRNGQVKAAEYHQIRDIYLEHAKAAEQAADDQWGGSEWSRRG